MSEPPAFNPAKREFGRPALGPREQRREAAVGMARGGLGEDRELDRGKARAPLQGERLEKRRGGQHH